MIKIKKYFKFDEFSATLKKEIIGGIATFFAMSYILSVNPGILSASPSWTGKEGIEYSAALFLATAIATIFGTTLMAFLAKVPIAQAPGMGLNAFLAFTLTTSLKLNYGEAMAITLISGILYLIVAITPLRKYFIKMMPENLKLSIGTGIGLFIAFVGLKNTGIITSDTNTFVKIGELKQPIVIIGLLTTLVIFILHYLKVPAGILIGMFFGTILLIILINANSFQSYAFYKEMPNSKETISVPFKFFGAYGQMDKITDLMSLGWNSLDSIWFKFGAYVGIFTFLYTDFFDTTGTLIACDKQGKISKTYGSTKWMEKANIADATATMFGASVGISTTTSYIESNVGISAGAKTGFASLITALCFVFAIALWPLMPVFMPIYLSNGLSYMPITAPVLIVVGSLMLAQLKHFEWKNTIDIPVLLITISFMAFGFSISSGIAAGIITFTTLNLVAGLLQKYTKLPIKISEDEIPSNSGVKFSKSKNVEIQYLKRINLLIVLTTLISILYFVIYAHVL